MKNYTLLDVEKYLKEHKRKKQRCGGIGLLAVLVVICTVIALIRPALTLENENQYSHTDSNAVEEETVDTDQPAEEETRTASNASAVRFPEADEEPQGNVYPAEGYGVMLLSEISEEGPALELSDYITDARILCRTDSNAEWEDVESVGTVPGNASFRIEIEYEGVQIETLENYKYKLTYTLPEIFENVTAKGDISDDGEKAGTITAKKRKITLAFSKKWIEEQVKDGNTELSGDFYAEATIDLSSAVKPDAGKLMIGNVEITINFEDDMIGKNADVHLTKEVGALTEDENGAYLEYKLHVKAGKYGCPAVVVRDEFSDHVQFIEEYVLEELEDVEIEGEAPGTLVWTVGDMESEETQTLAYKVKLKEAYTGVLSKGTITNTATVYSGENEYERGSDSAQFTPQISATISKTAAEYVADRENGGGSIRYTIWLHADEKNSYALKNVMVKDALDGSLSGGKATDSKIRQYLSYDETSFKLWQGGNEKQNGSEGLTELTEGGSFEFPETGDVHNSSFCCYVDSLKPGESKTLTYTVKVDAGVFAEMKNSDIQINNRAAIYTDPTRADGGNQWLNAYNTQKTISRKVWSRKLVGNRTEEEQTITMYGDIYGLSGENRTELLTGEKREFTIPAGCYLYEVAANEAGDWNLASAVMKDQLNNQYMEYVGYVQVNAYTIDAEEHFADDRAAVNALKAKDAVKTVWIKVDGRKNFQFRPELLGLDGTYAYLCSYYARPVKLQNVTSVLVTNEFILDGQVGIGAKQYQLTGVQVSAEVEMQGENYFSAEKQFWYYDAEQNASGDFKNGALYWVIRLNGGVLPEGTRIQDQCADTGGTDSYARETSVVRAYIGPETYTFSEDGVWDSLPDSFREQKIQNKTVSGDYDEDTALIRYDCDSRTSFKFELNQDVELESDEAFYIVLCTEPRSLPTGKRNYQTYKNKLLTADAAEPDNWVNQNTASYTIYGSDGIFKEHASTFTLSSDREWTTISSSKGPNIIYAELDGAGTYAAWFIQVNYNGNLSGSYLIEENIPEGMDLVFAKLYWKGPNAPVPVMGQIDEEILKTIKPGEWTEIQKNLTTVNFGKQDSRYYTNGQKTIWQIDNLKSSDKGGDNVNIEFQVVCKVTDPDVLQGGIEKEFNNIVVLKNLDGDEISRDSSAITLKRQTISKTGTYDPELNGGRYPFKIVLNEVGEDLVPNSDTITLVDELSKTLTLDATTIKVTDSKSGEERHDWTASVDGQVLKLILPDQVPLTITYETLVNAAPGEKISIENKAHWEGYSPSSGSSTAEENFSYKVGGTVGANKNPSVKIIKADKNDVKTYLPDASFKLEEMVYEDGEFKPADNGLVLAGTTDENGVLIFKDDMEFNTIYALTETEAPSGYVLDEVPHYFVIVKKAEGEETPEFPKEVKEYYQGAEYTYAAYNSKGEITLTKEFQDAAGREINKLDGRYEFGLFREEKPDEAAVPEQTVTLTFKDGQGASTAVFKNLDPSETYYIYELDDEGKPIRHGKQASVNEKTFVVSYTDKGKVVMSDDGKGAVTVVNRMNHEILPITGGRGTWMYTLSGILLMSAAYGLLWRRRKTCLKM